MRTRHRRIFFGSPRCPDGVKLVHVSHALAPGLLVAAPSLRCPFFNHTLVLMVDHGDEGSFGFVINRPAEIQITQVFEELGFSSPTEPPNAKVMLGGPVSPQTGWVVYDALPNDVVVKDEMRISNGLRMSASIDILEALARGDGPPRSLMMLGYAGWSPGQLEAEMREGAWFPLDVDLSLLFDVPLESRWREALASLGIDPARVAASPIASA